MALNGFLRKVFLRSTLLLFGTSLFVSGYVTQSYALNQHYVQHIEERLFSTNAVASVAASDCGICDLAQIVPETPGVILSIQVSPASEPTVLMPSLDSIHTGFSRTLGARAPPEIAASL